MPPTTGRSKARQASAIPSMASESSHITSGCSGLPKFRQLTSASGRAPTHARLRTDSATTRAVPARGSTAHQRWLPSVVRASARPVSTPVTGCLRRSTVASPPGPATVLRKSWWSYCPQTQAGSVEHPEQVGCRRRPARRAWPDRARPTGRGVAAAGGRAARPRGATPPGPRRRRRPPSRMRRAPPSVTRPTTWARTSQRRQSARTSSRSAGSTTASIRSWLSDVMISNGSRPGWRRATAETSTSMPTPPRLAISLVAQQSPAPPRSWIPTTRPASSSARQASIRRFSSNGSPTCTLGRLAASASASPKPAEASTDTPPMPSRPVLDPSSTARLPAPVARPSTSRSTGSSPRHSTLTSGFPS